MEMEAVWHLMWPVLINHCCIRKALRFTGTGEYNGEQLKFTCGMDVRPNKCYLHTSHVTCVPFHAQHLVCCTYIATGSFYSTVPIPPSPHSDMYTGTNIPTSVPTKHQTRRPFMLLNTGQAFSEWFKLHLSRLGEAYTSEDYTHKG